MTARATLLILLSAMLMGSAALNAQQSDLGSITGSVTDKTGATVPGAQVVATNLATGVAQSTVTTPGGIYSINYLQIGRYSVSVTKGGFQTEIDADVAVIAGQTATVNFGLRVGSSTQTVTVQSQSAEIDTTDTNQGTTRTLEELQNLPISMMGNDNRSAISAVQTVSGVNFNTQQSNGQAWTIFSRSQINGITGGGFAYEIDGVQASTGESENGEDWLAPTPDVIAELRVTTNTDATQGFNAGITIGLVTKSGTRDFHGSIAYYNRNDALEARNYFLPAKPEDKQNEGTWTLGGPVWIPHVYNGRNKTYFFAAMDIFRYVTTSTLTGQTTVNSVPTTLMRTGNFTQVLGSQIGTDALGRPVYSGEIYDPTSNQTLANGTVIRNPFMYNGQLNVIPPSQLSSISQFFGSHYSPPTNSGVVSNWVGIGSQSKVDNDEWSIRIDQAIGTKHRLTFSSERDFGFLASAPGCPYGTFTGPGTNGYVDKVDASGASINCENMYRYRFSYLWIAKPTLLINFRGGVSRDPHRDVFPNYPEGANAACQAGLTGTLSCRTPIISITNYSGIGPTSGGQQIHSQRTPFDLNVQWQRGRHLLSFGSDYVISPFSYGNSTNLWGTFAFNPLETSLPGTLSNQTGNGMASFYLGQAHSASVKTPFSGKWNSAEGALYAQDKWQINNKLTVTYGMRWELTSPGSEGGSKISNFDPNLPNPTAGNIPGALTIYGVGAGRNGLTRLGNYYYKAFAPKLGVVYAFSPQTVFRANFDISYFPYWSKWYSSNGPQVPTDGFSQTKTFTSNNSGVTPALNWQNGFQYTFPTFPIINPSLDNGGVITYLDTRYNRPPLVENIGAEIEKGLPGHVRIRVAYAGTLSHRMYVSYNLNTLPLKYLSLGSLLNQSITSAQAQTAGIAVPYPGFTGTVAQALTPYPQYTTVTDQEAQIGNASYNSLQINVQRHFGSLTFLGNATISKCLSDSTDPGNGQYLATLRAQSHELLRSAKSLCGFQPSNGIQSGDIPRQMALSWYWEVPVGRGKALLGTVSKPVNYVVGNWRLSALQYYQAGPPLAVTSNQSVPSLGTVWPVLNPGVNIKAVSGCGNVHPFISGQNLYLNKSAFSDAPLDTLGNVNVLPSVRACGYINEDIGLDKAVDFGDPGRNVSFGATFTNVLNRHQLTNLNTNIDNSNFGTFNSATFPRTVQIHVKIQF